MLRRKGDGYPAHRSGPRGAARSRSAVFTILFIAITASALQLIPAGLAARTMDSEQPREMPDRSPEALKALKTIVFENGRVSFTAREVEMQELFKTLADVGRFSIENVDLLPDTRINVSFESAREQDCLSQLLMQVPKINYIFLTRTARESGGSVIEKLQIYSQESSGIAPGSGSIYNPADYLMDMGGWGGADLFGEEGEGGPRYIPPAEPPKYIPPDEPPVYIPPAEPPRYIPPQSEPVYIPPKQEGSGDSGGGE